jgi:hypothetical protein
MIKVNTQTVDPVGETQAAANNGHAERSPGDFDTSSFAIPDRHLNPDGDARIGLGTRALKALDWGLTRIARVAFEAMQLVNRHRPNPSFTPKWSDKPLLKSWE